MNKLEIWKNEPAKPGGSNPGEVVQASECDMDTIRVEERTPGAIDKYGVSSCEREDERETFQN